MIINSFVSLLLGVLLGGDSVRAFLQITNHKRIHQVSEFSTQHPRNAAKLYLFSHDEENQDTKIEEKGAKTGKTKKRKRERLLSFLRSSKKEKKAKETDENEKGEENGEKSTNNTFQNVSIEFSQSNNASFAAGDTPILKSSVIAEDPPTRTFSPNDEAPVVVADLPNNKASVITMDPPLRVPPSPLATPEDPLTKAEALKAQAQRMKLEAEKMDAELTLQKIGRLEQELAVVQQKGNSTVDIVKEIDLLRRKIKGEPVETVPFPAFTTSTGSTGGSETAELEISSESDSARAPFNKKEFDTILNNFRALPSPQKLILARCVGLRAFTESDINATEVALRIEKQGRQDFSSLIDIPDPQDFTQEEIQHFKNKFDVSRWRINDEDLLGAESEDDKVLQKVMREEYYLKEISKRSTEPTLSISNVNADPPKNIMETFNDIMDEVSNQSETYKYIRSLFPKCIEKKGCTPSRSQVDTFVEEVLPAVKFTVNSDPIEVFGGYLIRGESRNKNGNELVDAIAAALENSTSLNGQLSISYIRDISGMLDIDDVEFQNAMMTSFPTSLLVMGPDVTRERQRILLSIVSAIGIATSWYLSIYPFLLNSALMKRAEEQVELANSGSQYDLSWLTDASVPLAVTFLGLQLAHELGHRVAAQRYGLKLTLPTLVPSLASGITSCITNLKVQPKNREELFDFAISGPALGIFASLIAMCAGLFLTLSANPSEIAGYPALPIDILRQSSLGGGLIEGILGDGVLNVQEAAKGVNTNIPLHPVAVAAYFSLVVNALSLLPIGVTDGGRISQAIFNRAGKQVIGQICLLGLFIAGAFGDDLFLSYALFCSFFQQGSEIPQRNEVDDISFTRVVLAITMGIVCLLSIIPMS